MPQAVYVVLTSPASPEREDEYNAWYDDVHLPEVTAVPGVTSARRYRMSEAQGRRFADLPGGHRYVALYHLDADDLASVLDEIAARVADGRIVMSDALGADPAPVAVVFEAF